MSATDLTGGKHKREFCFCGTEIKIMIFKGSGLCSVNCQKRFAGAIAREAREAEAEAFVEKWTSLTADPPSREPLRPKIDDPNDDPLTDRRAWL